MSKRDPLLKSCITITLLCFFIFIAILLLGYSTGLWAKEYTTLVRPVTMEREPYTPVKCPPTMGTLMYPLNDDDERGDEEWFFPMPATCWET